KSLAVEVERIQGSPLGPLFVEEMMPVRVSQLNDTWMLSTSPGSEKIHWSLPLP
ncbi:hypothetical protein HAX54_049533, partial [Datura stramonium]|nr:hypothetical protein [Datura stramonium]